MAGPVFRAASEAVARNAARRDAAARALRLKNYQETLARGPEALQLRADITAENAAARKARAAARENEVAPLLEAMRGNSAATAVGDDIPRPRPTADTLPSPAAPTGFVVDAAYPVDNARILELMDRVNAEGIDSLAPDDLILLEDLQSGKAYLSGSAQSAPLDAPQIEIAAPAADDLNGNLAASAIELDEAPKKGGAANLSPKKAKGPTKLEKIANEIYIIAGSARTGEAIAPRQARSTWSKIDKLSSDEFAALVRVMGDEESALDKLEQVQNIAGDAARDPNSLAAAAIDRAKQAREGTMRAPGSNSPEFATDTLADADMPTQLDDALAAQRERNIDLATRSPGGGLSLEDRLRLYGLDPADPNAARKLPFWLKGRDGRPVALESRSRGSRAIESNDIKVLRPLLKAREELAAAVTPEEQAAALKKVAAAEYALTRKFGQGGRKAMPDSRLNKGGQMETFNDALISIVGARPRAERSLTRSSPSMSAAERSALESEAVDAFGEDAFEFMPEESELDNVSDLGETGKPKKARGGRPLPSRVMGGLQTLFSDGRNPITMMGSAENVADQLMATQNIFRPGTANFDMARERLVREIENAFGGAGPQPATDAPAVSSRVQEPGVSAAAPIALPAPKRLGLPGPATASDINLESSAVEIVPVEGSVDAKPKRGGGKGRKDPVIVDAEAVAPVEGRLSREEIEAQASMAEQEAFQQAIDSGMSTKEARKAANARRKQVQKELLDANRVAPVEGSVDGKGSPKAEPSSGGGSSGPPDDPAKRGGFGADDADIIDSEPLPDATPAKNSGDGGGKPPSDPPGGKPRDGDADGTAPKPTPEKPLRRWRWVALAGGLGGAYVLSQMGGKATAGTSPTGPTPAPVPPGGAAAAGGAETEDALTRAINRIRGSRAGGSDRPSYQTLQNWN